MFSGSFILDKKVNFKVLLYFYIQTRQKNLQCIKKQILISSMMPIFKFICLKICTQYYVDNFQFRQIRFISVYYVFNNSYFQTSAVNSSDNCLAAEYFKIQPQNFNVQRNGKERLVEGGGRNKLSLPLSLAEWERNVLLVGKEEAWP